MLKKLARMMGVVLTLLMVSSLFAFALPVSAGTMAFGDEIIPGTTNKMVTNFNIQIADMAVAADGKTIYAGVADNITANMTRNAIYKSTDGGLTWTEYSKNQGTTGLTGAAFDLPAKAIVMVRIAPDNPDLVAFVTADMGIFMTNNGGSSWSGPITAPAGITTLNDLDISAASSGYNYMVVGGEGGAGVPQLWVMKMAVGEGFVARYNSATDNATLTQTAVSAVKFSPNFPTDKIVLVVSQNLTATTSFQIYSDDSKKWNGSVTGYDTYGRGVTITTVAPIAGAPGIIKASIAPDPTYSGPDESTRLVFVGMAASAGTGGVARIIDNNQDKSVTSWTNAALGPVRSVAYSGGKLLAGAFDTNQVFRSLDPNATNPKADRINQYKQPGGIVSTANAATSTNQTVVAWAGANAVATVSGANGAFASSSDDAYSFVDLSIINTALTNLTDVAVSKDGAKIYLSSNNGTFTSLWRYDGKWSRVFSTGVINFFARLAPEDANTVYIANMGGADVYVSEDGGVTNWKKRPSTKIAIIVDMVVQDKNTAHIIGANNISKTTNMAASWNTAKATGINGAMVTLAPNNDIIIGGAGAVNRQVSFSSDGGATFTTIDNTIGAAAANIVVTADDNYATNKILYASNTGDNVVRRGTASKTSSWSDKSGAAIDASQTISDLKMQDGVLYAVSNNATGPYVYRTFNPTVETVVWSAAITRAGRAFNIGVAPGALRISKSGTTVKLWAIDTAGTDELNSLNDVLVATPVPASAPAADFKVPINATTGQAYAITFTFDRITDKSTAGQLQIATDTDFRSLIINQQNIDLTGDKATIGVTVVPANVGLTPETTYYWRARVTNPWTSQWSETRKFTVEKLPSQKFEQVGPLPTTTVSVPPITIPTITVPPISVPQATVQVTIPEAKPVIPTGMLWVIIAIGAVLIIALIVLIVRTRRVP